MGDIPALVNDPAFGRFEKMKNRPPEGRFPATGFAHQTQRLPPINIEAYAINRIDPFPGSKNGRTLQKKIFLQIPYAQERSGIHKGAPFPAVPATRSQATKWPLSISFNSGFLSLHAVAASAHRG